MPWLERMNFCSSCSSWPPSSRSIDDPLGVDVGDRAVASASTTSPVSIAARRSIPVPTSGASVTSSGTAWRCMFEPISARLASSCSRNGIIAVATDQICSGRDVDQVDLLRRHPDVLAGLRAADDLLARAGCPFFVDLGVRLGDLLLLLLGRVDPDDLVGHDAVPDDAVGRRHEAVLGDLRVGRERADQADVRAFRRLDRAHPPIVGRVHVAHLDRRPLTGQAAGAERAQATAVGQPGERVRLVHELRQLAGAEELLQRRDDRADVDDRLRRDRVGVLGREALAHDALHPVEADPERLLDQLADRPQPAVAEVLVLVEVVLDRLARHRQRLGRVVLDLVVGLLGHAEQLRQRDELLDQRDDVVVGQRARVEVDVQTEPRVQLVTADARQVVALGIEEQLVAAASARRRSTAARRGAAS